MHTKLIKTSASLLAIAGILAASGAARAASQGDCDTYNAALPHLYVAGSSAIKPFILALSEALKATQTVIYVSGGSCVGVHYAIDSAPLSPLPTGADLGFIGAADNCTVPADKQADIGVSDVFATSCDGVTELPAGFGDIQGPIQTMNFVVPKGADAAIQSISAEAAYLVFGFDPSTTDGVTGKSYANGTPWTARDDIWIRGAGSGTQSMLAAAINVLPGSFALNNYVEAVTAVKHAVAGGAGEIVTRVGGATNLDTTIGLLASTELDDNRATIRGLAFQAYDQSCGYWPDSTSGSKDKLNVRMGKYDVWGALHMFTKVDNKGKPTNADAADFGDYINGIKVVPGVADALSVVKLEITKNLVPICAMQVSRDEEIGPMTSVNPTCSCFYDDVRLHGDDHKSFTGCTACTKDADCKTAGLSCSYGYCEAI